VKAHAPAKAARAKGWLELLRLPNVVTAAADSLAGWLLAGGALADLAGWASLAAVSMLLYAAGVALNDLLDCSIDAAERPRRPIPSGRVQVSAARWFCSLGLALGLALAGSTHGLAGLVIAGSLVLAILAYDLGLKRTWFGPLAMGACRALNLMLGGCEAHRVGGPAIWTAALAYGIFVAGITLISRAEVSGGGCTLRMAGLVLQNLCLLSLVMLALGRAWFPQASPLNARPPLEGFVILALVALVVNWSALKAAARPTPERIQASVKTGILSLVWIHAGLVASVRGPVASLPLLALWAAAFILARWLYAT